MISRENALENNIGIQLVQNANKKKLYVGMETNNKLMLDGAYATINKIYDDFEKEIKKLKDRIWELGIQMEEISK